MEMALRKNPQVFIYSDNLQGMYALHIAAASLAPKAVDAVRWLLEKGIAWCAMDGSGRLAEEWARMHNNQESWTVLRNWAIEFGDTICFSQTTSSLPTSQNTSYITPRTAGRGIIQTMTCHSYPLPCRSYHPAPVMFCAACAWMGTRGIKNSATPSSFFTSTHPEHQKTRWHLSQASMRLAS